VIDVQAVLNSFKSGIKIIAKDRNQEGVDNLDDILENVYGIMVARVTLVLRSHMKKFRAFRR